MVAIPGFFGGVVGGAGISVIISAVDRFSATFAAAQKGAGRTGAIFKTFAKTVGLVGVVATGTSVALSTQLETAMVGVRKTTELTATELEDLRNQFIEMSKATGTSAAEFANIGQIAGQLGIQSKADIQSFTQVVVEMASATVLSSDEAALGLARLAAIMDEPIDNSRKMASAMVALGNTVAANEQEILQMSLRLSGAGRVVGLTTAEVLGFAASLAELGIRVEAGGTAFSKLFIKLAAAISKGGKQIDLFSQTSGLAVDDFVKLFKEDAAGAVVLFLEGLGEIREQGGDVIAVLNKLGLSEVRLRDAILRVSGATDNLSTNINRSKKEFEDGTAVNEEFTASLDSVASQFGILRERIKSTLITNNKWLKSLLTGINLQTDYNNAIKNLNEEFEKQNLNMDQFNIIQAQATLTLVSGERSVEAYRQGIKFLNFELLKLQLAAGDQADFIGQNFSPLVKDLGNKFKDTGGDVIILETAYDRLQLASKELESQKNELIARLIEEEVAQDIIISQVRALEAEYPKVARAIDLFTTALEGTRTPAEELENKLRALRDRGIEFQKQSRDMWLDTQTGAHLTAEEVQKVREEQEKLGTTTEETTDTVTEKFSEVQGSIEAVKKEIETTKDVISSLGDISLQTTVDNFKKIADEAVRLNNTGIAGDLIALERARIQQAVSLAQIGARKEVSLAEIKVQRVDDFILRPGQAPISISPEDTVVGFKGDSPIGTTIDKVDIIIQGAGRSSLEIGREVEERLAALGKPVIGV